jgi:hypothetical protein
MVSHTYHPDTHTNGLADDCERCKQHTERPWVSLDETNLEVLRGRIALDLPGRTFNESTAMLNLAAYDKERVHA